MVGRSPILSFHKSASPETHKISSCFSPVVYFIFYYNFAVNIPQYSYPHQTGWPEPNARVCEYHMASVLPLEWLGSFFVSGCAAVWNVVEGAFYTFSYIFSLQFFCWKCWLGVKHTKLLIYWSIHSMENINLSSWTDLISNNSSSAEFMNMKQSRTKSSCAE